MDSIIGRFNFFQRRKTSIAVTSVISFGKFLFKIFLKKIVREAGCTNEKINSFVFKSLFNADAFVDDSRICPSESTIL